MKCLPCAGTGKQTYNDGEGNCMMCGGTGETPERMSIDQYLKEFDINSWFMKEYGDDDVEMSSYFVCKMCDQDGKTPERVIHDMDCPIGVIDTLMDVQKDNARRQRQQLRIIGQAAATYMCDVLRLTELEIVRAKSPYARSESAAIRYYAKLVQKVERKLEILEFLAASCPNPASVVYVDKFKSILQDASRHAAYAAVPPGNVVHMGARPTLNRYVRFARQMDRNYAGRSIGIAMRFFREAVTNGQ